MFSGLKLGLVGFPNVGKSSLFSLLTNSESKIGNYPFCTIDPNIATVPFIDERLKQISKIACSRSIIFSEFQLVDIAGLVKGANEGKGLGNSFLSFIREVNALIYVLRCFEDNKIINVNNSVNPAEDLEFLQLELILSDINILDKLQRTINKLSLAKKREEVLEAKILQAAYKGLKENKMLIDLKWHKDEIKILNKYQFITIKKFIVLANTDFDCINCKHYLDLKDHFKNFVIIPMCISLENEIKEMAIEEANLLLEDFNYSSVINNLLEKSVKTFNHIFFFTSSEKESRSWVLKEGSTILDAAEKIHSDIKKHFIKADVINWKILVDENISMPDAIKDKVTKSVKKDYIVKDGDVILFVHGAK